MKIKTFLIVPYLISVLLLLRSIGIILPDWLAVLMGYSTFVVLGGLISLILLYNHKNELDLIISSILIGFGIVPLMLYIGIVFTNKLLFSYFGLIFSALIFLLNTYILYNNSKFKIVPTGDLNLKHIFKPRLYVYFILIFIIFTFLSSVYFPVFFYDPWYYWMLDAKNFFLSPHDLSSYYNGWSGLRLYPPMTMLMQSWVYWCGAKLLSEHYIRVLFSIFGSITLISSLRLCNELYGKNTSKITALLLLSLPAFVMTSIAITTMDTVVMAYYVSAILFLYLACSNKDIRLWTLSGTLFGLTLFIKQTAFLLMPTIPLFLVIFLNKYRVSSDNLIKITTFFLVMLMIGSIYWLHMFIGFGRNPLKIASYTSESRDFSFDSLTAFFAYDSIKNVLINLFRFDHWGIVPLLTSILFLTNSSFIIRRLKFFKNQFILIFLLIPLILYCILTNPPLMNFKSVRRIIFVMPLLSIFCSYLLVENKRSINRFFVYAFTPFYLIWSIYQLARWHGPLEQFGYLLTTRNYLITIVVYILIVNIIEETIRRLKRRTEYKEPIAHCSKFLDSNKIGIIILLCLSTSIIYVFYPDVGLYRVNYWDIKYLNFRDYISALRYPLVPDIQKINNIVKIHNADIYNLQYRRIGLCYNLYSKANENSIVLWAHDDYFCKYLFINKNIKLINIMPDKSTFINADFTYNYVIRNDADYIVTSFQTPPWFSEIIRFDPRYVEILSGSYIAYEVIENLTNKTYRFSDNFDDENPPSGGTYGFLSDKTKSNSVYQENVNSMTTASGNTYLFSPTNAKSKSVIIYNISTPEPIQRVLIGVTVEKFSGGTFDILLSDDDNRYHKLASIPDLPGTRTLSYDASEHLKCRDNFMIRFEYRGGKNAWTNLHGFSIITVIDSCN